MDKYSEVFKEIINKQLELYNVDYNYVVKNKEIEGKPWYIYYTFKTKEDFDNWKNFSIKLMINNLKYNKEYSKKTFEMINFNYGLKKDYEDH